MGTYKDVTVTPTVTVAPTPVASSVPVGWPVAPTPPTDGKLGSTAWALYADQLAAYQAALAAAQAAGLAAAMAYATWEQQLYSRLAIYDQIDAAQAATRAAIGTQNDITNQQIAADLAAQYAAWLAWLAAAPPVAQPSFGTYYVASLSLDDPDPYGPTQYIPSTYGPNPGYNLGIPTYGPPYYGPYYGVGNNYSGSFGYGFGGSAQQFPTYNPYSYYPYGNGGYPYGYGGYPGYGSGYGNGSYYYTPPGYGYGSGYGGYGSYGFQGGYTSRPGGVGPGMWNQNGGQYTWY